MLGESPLSYTLKRLRDLAGAVRIFAGMKSRERWPAERRHARRQQLLNAIVRHAAANSCFYGDLYSGNDLSGDIDLAKLPTIDRAQMMDNFDRLVTDLRLRRDDIDRHVTSIAGDVLYLDEYRVLRSSGSVGLRGFYLCNRKEWRTVVAASLMRMWLAGVTPSVPGWKRISRVSDGPGPASNGARVSNTMNLGIHRIQRLPASTPLPELVRDLNAFQPHTLHGYTSLLALLAAEQLDGRLSIRPERVYSSREPISSEMSDRMKRAWGASPFQTYGMTEVGLALAGDCPHHAGMHLFEDVAILEVVDSHDQPVAAGKPGARVLVTNLYNHTQPLIRCEVSDILTMSAEPCPCGRTMPMIKFVEGRLEDAARMRRQDGAFGLVYPDSFHQCIGRLPGVKEFQVVHNDSGLLLRLVPREVPDRQSVANALRNALAQKLTQLGFLTPPIEIQWIESDRLDRDFERGGKLKTVVSTTSASSPSATPAHSD